ncbi:hypothetical protein BCR39DRAFT_559641 [Naematelia encephala]|uniref:DUF2231 domain-containing protein n=1 Tax=Naematelia encephala TaxID=71784 RepID=A0A1Y2B0Y1_9TREE|nr:hypothetical protein BCR39DRAFT_559641 [Naematelia encephala]
MLTIACSSAERKDIPAADMSPTTRAAEAAEQAAHQTSQVLQGRIPNQTPDKALGHPIHPSTVHWPIAFLSASFGIVSLNLVPSAIISPLSKILPPLSTLPALAHYAAAAGVLTAIPSIVTGLGEGYEMFRAQVDSKGDWRTVVSDAWNMVDDGGRKLHMTAKHASMNDAVVLLAAANWFHGYKYPTQALPLINTILSAISLPALLYSAMIGGRLVYEYAVGVQRQGHGLEVKEKSQ